ncbi:MAG: putative toxin-antitoxin system toxin component, PIN family [Caldilineaceae bacterium]|nr:putative toxin-antitoxin system toxin component, PIN family [Caldilineaceae bacterium]
MRVVIDTNVFVSALLSPTGVPNQIFHYWELSYFDLLVSQESLDELERVLHYPKIRKRLRSTEEELAEFVNIFQEKALMVTRQETITVITADVSDNLYLEIGLAGHADYVVSGDQHLLRLKKYRGISIITPTEFQAIISLPAG